MLGGRQPQGAFVREPRTDSPVTAVACRERLVALTQHCSDAFRNLREAAKANHEGFPPRGSSAGVARPDTKSGQTRFFGPIPTECKQAEARTPNRLDRTRNHPHSSKTSIRRSPPERSST